MGPGSMPRFPKIPVRTGILLVLFLVVNACVTMGQPAVRIEHYTLEYTPPGPADRALLPVILKIERFSVAPSYSTRQMVYRDRSFKRETYAYHHWRAHPGDLISDYLLRDMRRSGLFRAVLEEGSTLATTHVLQGSLDEFFEWNDEEGWKAVLTMTATLINSREADPGKKILFQKTFRTLEPCKEKSPAGLAEAMSKAMARVSGKIIDTVYDHLS